MRAPFSFWAASPQARARFRRLFAAMSLMLSGCRFAVLCPDRSPRHRIQPAPPIALRPAACGTVAAAIALLAEGTIASIPLYLYHCVRAVSPMALPKAVMGA